MVKVGMCPRVQALGNIVRRTLLATLLILTITTVHASTPGEEHTFAVFQDDFEDWDGEAWELNIGPNASYGASWKVMDDGGNMVLSVKGTVGVAAGASYWADYTLMVRVKLVDMPEYLGVQVRMGETGRGYIASFSPTDVVFTKSLGWGAESICFTKVESTLSSDTWHTLKIVCVGDEFRVYVDNELKVEAKDETDPVLSGRIGFAVGPNSNVYFDDVWVAATRADYAGYLITGAQLLIDEAKAMDADVDEPERLLDEARAKLEEGDLGAAAGLADAAAEKAKGNMELAAAERQEPPPEAQQPAAQQGTPLSIERVATLLTIGGAIAGVAGWVLKARGDRRKRAILFSELVQGTDDTYERYKADARQCEAELQRIKDRAINEYKKNLITEKDYNALNEKIKEYIRRLRESTGKQQLGTQER
ncbi:MAG TPA: family 16 glycoside hydrolase [Candidatus Bathyarchaeia archaeon]